jgi:hypothetical protein
MFCEKVKEEILPNEQNFSYQANFTVPVISLIFYRINAK